MKAQIKYFKVTDIESNNPAHSNNGGDYYYGRIIVVSGKTPIAVRHWTSADFEYCPVCGSFQNPLNDEHFERFHGPMDRAKVSDGEGWQSGVEVSRFVAEAWRDHKEFTVIGS